MTAEEHVRSDIRLALACFEHNVAEVWHEGELTVVDWRIPGSDYHYFVHLVFDPRRSMVYVSGDFGSMVIRPTCLVTLEGMANTFTRKNADGTYGLNTGYFCEKVECAQLLHQYDGDDAAQEVRERAEGYLQEKADESESDRETRRKELEEDGIDEAEIEETLDDEFGSKDDAEPEFDVDELCDAVNGATDDARGCNLTESVGYGDSIASVLEKIDADYWEWAYDLGKHPSQQVVFTLMAFRLAYDWLEAHKDNNETQENTENDNGRQEQQA